MFSLYYYLNLIKLIQYGTFSRLKSVSSTEDNYIETATGGVLQKKLFLKNLQYLQENAYLGVAF